MIANRPWLGAERLPKAHDGCTCECHRVPGVYHCVPCCGPSRGRAFGHFVDLNVDTGNPGVIVVPVGVA